MGARVHDLGGRPTAEAIDTADDGRAFAFRWEARMLGLQRAMGFTRAWTIDGSRWAQERIAPDTYLRVSYYHRWALGLVRNARACGLLSDDELRLGRALRGGPPVARVMTPATVRGAFVRGTFSRPPAAPARFAVGARVRTRAVDHAGHTRLPGYARRRPGIVDAVRGCHVLPDTNATGEGEHPQWLYSVRFRARDLWGDDGDPDAEVSIEAFEPYLEPA